MTLVKSEVIVSYFIFHKSLDFIIFYIYFINIYFIFTGLLYLTNRIIYVVKIT